MAIVYRVASEKG